MFIKIGLQYWTFIGQFFNIQPRIPQIFSCSSTKNKKKKILKKIVVVFSPVTTILMVILFFTFALLFYK
jgi:hypothetical protein